MRIFITITALLMIPVLILVHLVMFNDEMRPLLTARIQADLERIGITKASVHLSYLDASISGQAASLEVRERAAAAVLAQPGVRLFSENNHIQVPAQLKMETDPENIRLSGWLPGETDVQTVIDTFVKFRPDLKVDAKKLRISNYVVLEAKNPPIGMEHPLVAPLIDKLRLPASLKLVQKDNGYHFAGRVPTEELRESIIQAATAAAPHLNIEGDQLSSGVCVTEAPFTQSESLLAFISSFFDAPAPGQFSFEEGGTATIEADVTPELKNEWLPRVESIIGRKDVNAKFRLFSAVYLLPGYRPQWSLTESEAEPLVSALAQMQIYFDPESDVMIEEEVEKLKMAVPAMQVCGPELQLVISGWGGPVTETPEKHLARSRAVLEKLVDLGIDRNQMEIVSLGTLYPIRVLPPGDANADRPRVELLAR